MSALHFLQILLDTPGLTSVSKVKRCVLVSSVSSLYAVKSHSLVYERTLCFHRHQLEKSLLTDPWNTVKEADLSML